MLLVGILISIIIGYIRGGKLRRFENITIKLWYFISVAFLIQTIALRVPQINDNMFYILHLLSYVIIMYVCIINWRKLSVSFMGIGTLLNMIVIALNSGQMPVKVPDFIQDPLFDRGHTLMTDVTKAKILGDLFLLDIPFFGGVFSVGDVFLVLGASLLIQYAMMYQLEETKALDSIEDVQ